MRIGSRPPPPLSWIESSPQYTSERGVQLQGEGAVQVRAALLPAHGGSEGHPPGLQALQGPVHPPRLLSCPGAVAGLPAGEQTPTPVPGRRLPCHPGTPPPRVHYTKPTISLPESRPLPLLPDVGFHVIQAPPPPPPSSPVHSTEPTVMFCCDVSPLCWKADPCHDT